MKEGLWFDRLHEEGQDVGFSYEDEAHLRERNCVRLVSKRSGARVKRNITSQYMYMIHTLNTYL